MITFTHEINAEMLVCIEEAGYTIKEYLNFLDEICNQFLNDLPDKKENEEADIYFTYSNNDNNFHD